MFGFIERCLFTGLVLLWTLTSVNLLSCISMSNQECKVRPQIINVNGDNPVFFCLSIKTSKCSGSCDSINNPHAKLCVPDVVKNLNVKVFNLMSRSNETRHIEWYEPCKWEFRINSSACNDKQRWNDDKCRCECEKWCGYNKFSTWWNSKRRHALHLHSLYNYWFCYDNGKKELSANLFRRVQIQNKRNKND